MSGPTKASRCGCYFEDPTAEFGKDGFHFAVALENWCWTHGRITTETTRSEETGEAPETVQLCAGGCQRIVTPQGGQETRTPDRPSCVYRGRPFAVERCPEYVSKMVRQKPDGTVVRFTINPDDRMRLIANVSGSGASVSDGIAGRQGRRNR